MLNASKKNSASIVAEKLLRAVINMMVFSALARSLGPEILGMFSLTQAVFILGYPIALAVNEQILLKYLLVDKRPYSKLRLSALKLKYISSFTIYLIATIFSYFYFEEELFKVAAVYCLIYLVNVDIIYFAKRRSEQKSYEVLKVTALVLLPFGILKMIVAIKFQDLLMVACAYFLEAAILAAAAYTTSSSQSKTSDNTNNADVVSLRELHKHAWPIAASAVLISVYLRLDQFMIDAMLNREELGYYSTAVKVSEAVSSIITAYLISTYPALLKLRNSSIEEYEKAVVQMLRRYLAMSVALTLAVYFFGEYLLVYTFGREYSAARNVLTIHVAGSMFVYYGIVCTQWLVAEGLTIYRLYRTLAGVFLNVGLNIILIPKMGIIGAATATVLVQAFSSVIFNAFSPKTRPILSLQIRSICSVARYGNTK